MNLLKIFYQKTNYFWSITRILYSILFTIAILDYPNEKNIPKITVKLLFTIYVLLIILLSILSILKKKQPKLIRQFVGIFSVFVGFFLTYLLIFEIKQNFVILTFLLSFWIILYGIWEITKETNYR